MTTAHRRGIIPTLSSGLRLEIARRTVAASQRDFAKLIGVSQNTVQRAEAGHPMKRTTVLAWAMATGVDLDWLETGETPPPDGDGVPGSTLPQLDSNQQPFDNTDAEVIELYPAHEPGILDPAA